MPQNLTVFFKTGPIVQSITKSKVNPIQNLEVESDQGLDPLTDDSWSEYNMVLSRTKSICNPTIDRVWN